MIGVRVVLSKLLLVISLEYSYATKTAFIIVDVQNCFIPGGTLPVPNGDTVIGPINKILDKVKFDLVIRTQDWHCKKHVSFASQHEGKKPFDVIELTYTAAGKLCGKDPKTVEACKRKDVVRVNQTLWPDHCVIGTTDAEFASKVKFPSNVVTVQKGYDCDVDSYSAFFNNGRFSHTELNQKLKDEEIKRLYVSGLAADFCVSWTAKDGKKLDYDTSIVLDASAAISDTSLEREKALWKSVGVKVINTDTLINELGTTNLSFRVMPSLLVEFSFISLYFILK